MHEGYINAEGNRKELKNVMYFGGLYRGKENETLWKEIKEYIEKEYETEEIEKIYLQSDGGACMKKGIELSGAEFVPDEFHIQKYIRRMMRVSGEDEEEKKKIEEWLEKGNRKKIQEWVENKKGKLGEKEAKKLEGSWKYIKNNWKGIQKRIKKEEGVTGSSTESHISYLLSARLSSRPMGWGKRAQIKWHR